MLLLTFREAVTRRRPLIRHTREKHWRRCGLLPIFVHIFMVESKVHFTLVTDHQPLRWLMESDKLTGKLARWVLLLQEYDFEVVYRAGITNLDADGLSRNPSPSNEDLTGARWHGDCN
jgi:hypothetical protein